jgi:hypothetical protein
LRAFQTIPALKPNKDSAVISAMLFQMGLKFNKITYCKHG